jgi:GPH family glycoside/pentoside/hexuronide:cation symporter
MARSRGLGDVYKRQSLPFLGLWGYTPGQQDADAVVALGLAYGLLPCVLKLLAGLALYAGLMRRPDLILGPDMAHPSAHSLVDPSA